MAIELQRRKMFPPYITEIPVWCENPRPVRNGGLVSVLNYLPVGCEGDNVYRKVACTGGECYEKP